MWEGVGSGGEEEEGREEARRLRTLWGWGDWVRRGRCMRGRVLKVPGGEKRERMNKSWGEKDLRGRKLRECYQEAMETKGGVRNEGKEGGG